MSKKETGSRSAADFLPAEKSIPRLRAAAADCRGCDLYKNAIQTVFGEGNPDARVMLVGEQPGDAEDKSGHPFVGPAGKLLWKALDEAGVDRDDVYITNAVKHFNFQEVGKRRLHKKPKTRDVHACLPWLDVEIAQVRPQIIVCLGATAAQALFGRSLRVTQKRGQLLTSDRAPYMMATIHPSSILRAPDSETRHAEMARFVDDLKNISEFLKKSGPKPWQRTQTKRAGGA